MRVLGAVDGGMAATSGGAGVSWVSVSYIYKALDPPSPH